MRSRLLATSVITLTSVLTLLFALSLRFDFEWTEIYRWERFGSPLLLLVLCRVIFFQWARESAGSWRYFSIPELHRLLLLLALSSVAFTASLQLSHVSFFPRSVVAIEFLLAAAVNVWVRLAVRLQAEHPKPSNLGGVQRKCLVLGAGRSGHLFVKMLRTGSNSGLRPVGVLDDDDKLRGSNVHDVPVVGHIRELQNVLDTIPRIEAVVLAIPSMSAPRLEQIRQILDARGIELVTLRSLDEIVVKTVSKAGDSITIEELLKKSRSVLHPVDVRDRLKARNILVTGGGGSIGSEIVRQLSTLDPGSITVFDTSEYNLFRLGTELSKEVDAGQIRLVLGDIRDRNRIDKLMASSNFDVVFHAAALKHVPLSQDNAAEFYLTNVLGTMNVLEASRRSGVQRFVLISSDKAVAPLSILGMTKRLAEHLILSSRHDSAADSESFSAVAVRFGNVINSAGSVIPLFKEQILAGGPITVTHPDMERFFMSIQEAVQLVLRAGLSGTGGEIFVLDMGEKIKIVELAKMMATLYGQPNISIVFTGLRPGERLSEEVADSNEALSGTIHAGVQVVTSPQPVAAAFIEAVLHLETRLQSLDNQEVIDSIKGLLPEVG